MKRLAWVGSVLAACIIVSGPALAQDKPVAVATFSILADLTQRVAGDHAQVLTLVGPNGDAHVFEPGPKESAELAGADLLVANGLGFEPWLHRLEDASGFKGKVLVASDGVTPLAVEAEHEGEAHEAGGRGKRREATLRASTRTLSRTSPTRRSMSPTSRKGCRRLRPHTPPISRPTPTS